MVMGKRTDGAGSVTEMKDGRFWARAPRQPNGSRPSLGFHETRAEAELAVRAGRKELEESVAVPKNTFAKFAAGILDERERSGIRGIASERKWFDAHVAPAVFAQMPLASIKPSDVAAWLRQMETKKARICRRGQKAGEVLSDRPLARSSITRILTLVRSIFNEALPGSRGLIETNPAVGLKIKRRPGKEATKAKEVYLSLEEQLAIRTVGEATPLERRFILFAFGSGIRRGEQFNLELADVHLDAKYPHAVVRFGSDGLPTKNGKILEVPLFGFALEAAREQIAYLEASRQPNPHKLLWPTEGTWNKKGQAVGGGRRHGKPLGNGHFREQAGGTHVYEPGKKNPTRVKPGTGTHVYVDRFREILEAAGITRPVRWHDMRHSCASALIQGLWGDAWTLAEVSAQLNHSSIAVTGRYAHLGDTALKAAAKKVGAVGGALVSGASVGDPGIAAIRNDFNLVESRGIEPPTSSMPSRGIVDLLRALAKEKPTDNPLVTNLAGTLAALLEEKGLNS
jgi:integrase